MADYRRPHHRAVNEILQALDGAFLQQTACYFGGGTRLALAFDEYRESRDIDFLCSSRPGYALLRSEVSEQSLGRILRKELSLAREVRADRDGIRTFFAIDQMRIKFEILLEARIDLTGAIDRDLGVPALTIEHAIAEKFLANTDRGLDDSSLARDLIDLAFVAAHVDQRQLQAGFAIAEQAYGSAVGRTLALTLERFTTNRARAKSCIETLAIDDTATVRKGMRLIKAAVG
jgi:Nucleotidyl transferase AbiEii toxin, Type IV TA system